MKFLVSSSVISLLITLETNSWPLWLQVVLPLLVASSLAAPPNPYGGGQQAAQDQWAPSYGSQSQSFPSNNRASIAEIQAQWNRFLEHLPWLTGEIGRAS